MSEHICPQCKNVITDEDALLCHFCGESLNRTSADMLGKMRGAGSKMVWISIVCLILLAFGVLLIL